MALIACGECKANMSSEALACPACGKPNLAGAAANKKGGGTGCLGAVTIAFAISLVLVLLVTFVPWFIGRFGLLRPAAAPANGSDEVSKRRDTVRVLRQNISVDDHARAFIFQGALSHSGNRCDEVTTAIMGAPGVWTVNCAPGYVYRLSFDSEGEVTGAQRLR
jgi:hypothetical protein